MINWQWSVRYRVFIQHHDGNETLCYSPQCTLAALLEAKRRYPSLPLRMLMEEPFAEALRERYEEQAGAQKIMQDLGHEWDLHRVVDTLPDSTELLESDDGAPVVKLINALLHEAIKEGASDIHIEPYEKALVVRFRIDGMLREVLSPPRQLTAYLLSRIKIMAQLDIAEKRVPQDGRIALRLAGRSIDVRVSTLPASHGERIVLRLLDKQNLAQDLAQTGMRPPVYAALQELLTRPHGILLVTGPTGSGKSTTLYAALGQLDSSRLNIMTVEDPVEFDLPGIGQTQVNPKVDMSFARGLRAILRQDPDVVMIGEIRDAETASIAVQASLTGHLVLSTLHTNSAIGAIERLRDMGVEPFLLANSLTGVLAQRLVRRLCPHCRKQTNGAHPLLKSQGITQRVWQASGCAACQQTGYRGRTGIHELIVINDDLRRAIASGTAGAALQHSICLADGTLLQDGLAKALSGETSVEEILRVVQEQSG